MKNETARREIESLDYYLQNHTNDYSEESHTAMMMAVEALEQETKTGKWIAQDIHNCHTDFKCSECGYIHSFMHLYGKPTADYTYCPNCGCRMVEPQERSGEECI